VFRWLNLLEALANFVSVAADSTPMKQEFFEIFMEPLVSLLRVCNIDYTYGNGGIQFDTLCILKLFLFFVDGCPANVHRLFGQNEADSSQASSHVIPEGSAAYFLLTKFVAHAFHVGNNLFFEFHDQVGINSYFS
jgi:hypothetical protein